MTIVSGIPDQRGRFRNPVITLGSFDGVHMGHMRIFSMVQNIARQKGGDPIVITFTQHPRKIITPRTPPRILTTASEKVSAIQSCGIGNIILLDFTAQMAQMTATEFFNEIVLKKLGIIDIVVGYDHAFGRNREGNIDFLREISKHRGFGVTRVEPKSFYSRPISSTWIRTELEDGNVRLAASLLGRRYAISGMVVRGAERGRTIGFPTANLVPDDADKVIPKDGVYAVTVLVGGAERYEGMLNIGTNPTFANIERTIETHLFDFSRDIYGSSIEIEFVDRIRDEQKFDSVDELVAQIGRDGSAAREILREAEGNGTIN
jgi:riboflavin kinase / FMN adenylyltransferase